MTWITDTNGNRCSVEYWGSEEAARKALDSLENCSRCSDCSDCSGCSSCSRCSDCSGCSGCSDCSGCSGCSRCSDCSGCSGCSDCSGCSGCSRCSRCSDCSGCSSCSDCSDCSRCSRCSRCSDCSGCSSCSSCSDCSDCSGYAPSAQPIAIPVIQNIHKAVYAAATATPDSLHMSSWHTCETTHCRAGWVVTLAGAEGKALESRFDTLLAAMMIYDASDPGFKISPCRFFDSNEKALEDMRKLAERTMEAKAEEGRGQA